MKKIVLVIPALALAGCVATSPDGIKATPTPEFAYQSASCEQLQAEDRKIVGDLGYYEFRQSRRRTQDVGIRIFVWKLP